MSVDNQKYLSKSIVSTNYLKNWYVERGADSKHIEVCYTNIDIDYWDIHNTPQEQLKAELSLPNIPVIFFSGRITKQKQPLVLAKTIKKLIDKNITAFKMVVAGDGDLFKELQNYTKAHHLQSHITLLGAISNKEVKRYLQTSDIYFLPSEHEGLALAIYEAMACGKVVVGADVSGQKELVTESCGFLIPRSDFDTESDQYADVLQRLLNNPSMIVEMGLNARNRIETDFTIDKMYNCINNIISQLPEKTKIRNNTFDASLRKMAVSVTEYYQPLSLFLHGDMDTFEAKKSKEIQAWYDKEYEVLPLWFKRLGHVVKIIGGKRKLNLPNSLKKKV